MKKLTPIFILLLAFVSCDEAANALKIQDEFTVPNVLFEPEITAGGTCKFKTNPDRVIFSVNITGNPTSIPDGFLISQVNVPMKTQITFTNMSINADNNGESLITQTVDLSDIIKPEEYFGSFDLSIDVPVLVVPTEKGLLDGKELKWVTLLAKLTYAPVYLHQDSTYNLPSSFSEHAFSSSIVP